MTLSPTCPTCQRDEFELRVLRDEGVAAARCVNCSSHYLLLDSEDYWFDVIQKGYPRSARCSCKSESFRLSIDYNVRDDGDVDYIEVHSICSVCRKRRRQLGFEVDYGGTDQLVNRPLVPTKNPKVLYDLRDLSLRVTLADVERIVDHLNLDENAAQGFVASMRSQDRWVLVRQDVAGIKATIAHGKFRFIYALPLPIEIADEYVNTSKKEDAFWKRSAVIRIGEKSHVCTYSHDGRTYTCDLSSPPPAHSIYTELGLSLSINFANEFVHDDQVVSKADSFRNATGSLLAMLQREFVSWRGRDCFDNPDVNVKIFGDRFRKKTAAKSKHSDIGALRLERGDTDQ